MITVHDIAYHRNGVGGEGFYVVLFGDPEENPDGRMVAIHFPNDDKRLLTAVLDVDQLSAGNIAFAEGNSWRGDHYHADIQAAIQVYEQVQEQEWKARAGR
jgi:hypothetical protein